MSGTKKVPIDRFPGFVHLLGYGIKYSYVLPQFMVPGSASCPILGQNPTPIIGHDVSILESSTKAFFRKYISDLKIFLHFFC
jgi:hypothetical protein